MLQSPMTEFGPALGASVHTWVPFEGYCLASTPWHGPKVTLELSLHALNGILYFGAEVIQVGAW